MTRRRSAPESPETPRQYTPRMLKFMLLVISAITAFESFLVYKLSKESIEWRKLVLDLTNSLDEANQLISAAQTRAENTLATNQELADEYERVFTILRERGLDDLVQEIRTQEGIIALQQSALSTQGELINVQDEFSALIEARLSEVRRRVLEIYGTCTPDQSTALEQAHAWLRANESAIQAAMRITCETTPSLDCPGELYPSGLFSDLPRSRVFCPSRDTLNAILTNEQNDIVGWALPQGYGEGFPWGAYVVADSVFYNGPCDVATTAGHEFVGHLLLEQRHALGENGRVDQQDWVYRLGGEIQRLCLADSSTTFAP